VRNVVLPRKADANLKSARSALKQGPCRNRRRKNLPVAAAPAKNNSYFKRPLLFHNCRGFLYLQLTYYSCQYSKPQSKIFQSITTTRWKIFIFHPFDGSESFDNSNLSLYFSRSENILALEFNFFNSNTTE
jgi:hypothetical protein